MGTTEENKNQKKEREGFFQGVGGGGGSLGGKVASMLGTSSYLRSSALYLMTVVIVY